MNLILPERLLRQLLEQGLFRNQLSDRLTLICWVMLMAGAAIWIVLGRSKRGYEITSAYWLMCGLGIRLCLYLRLESIIPSALLVISGISFLFAFVPMWYCNRQRKRAWPNHLERLTRSYMPPGGLTTSITGLALLVFFLALCYITSVHAARACFLMSVSLLLLIQYDYRAESAMAAMVLMSLAVVSAFLDMAGASGKSSPAILSLVIIPLSYLSFHWVWLGKVWSQQIIGSEPLTTSARMVRLTRHIGVMLLGFSTLLAVKLALWPLMPASDGFDNSTTRFLLMAVAFFFLLGSSFWMWVGFGLPTMGGLAMLNVFGAGVAFVTRMPKFYHEVFQPNWLVISVGYVGLTLMVAFLVGRRRGRISDR